MRVARHRLAGRNVVLVHLFLPLLAFDLRSSRPLLDPDAFLEWAAPRLAGGGERFVLLDEVQLLGDFESVLKSDISLNTVKAYIGCLEDSFLVSAASRYDVKGRKYIGAPLKYYFEDVGLRNARVGFRQSEENHLMENVIYNELRTSARAGQRRI